MTWSYDQIYFKWSKELCYQQQWLIAFWIECKAKLACAWFMPTHPAGDSQIIVICRKQPWLRILPHRIIINLSRMLTNLKNQAGDDNVELVDDGELSITFRVRRQCWKHHKLVNVVLLVGVLFVCAGVILAVVFGLKYSKSSSKGM